MPEVLALAATEVGGWFAADAAFGGAASALTAEEAAGMGIVGAGTGELSAAEAAALVGGGAAAGGGLGGAGAALADAGTGAAGMGIADATGGLVSGGEIGGAGLGGTLGAAVAPETMGSAIASAGGTSAVQPATGSLESLFGSKGTLAQIFAKNGMAQNIMQLASGGYGLMNSIQAGNLARRPNQMGAQAVQRSMAAQGYQGSGNMMAALNQYGINGSLAASQAMMGPLTGAMSSLGLMTGGITGAFGSGMNTGGGG